MYEGNDHIFCDGIMRFDYEPPLDHSTAQRSRIGCVSGLAPKGNEIELVEKSPPEGWLSLVNAAAEKCRKETESKIH